MPYPGLKHVCKEEPRPTPSVTHACEIFNHRFKDTQCFLDTTELKHGAIRLGVNYLKCCFLCIL